MPAQSAAGETERERERAAVQRVDSKSCPITGNWASAESTIDCVEVVVAAEDVAEQRREHEQQREDREEAVVGDRRGEIAALVVGVLLADGEREAQPACRCWKRSKAAIRARDPAHVRLISITAVNHRLRSTVAIVKSHLRSQKRESSGRLPLRGPCSGQSRPRVLK